MYDVHEVTWEESDYETSDETDASFAAAVRHDDIFQCHREPQRAGNC